MADIITGVTEVDVTIEEIVSLSVQEVLTSEMIMPQTVLDYSAQVGPGMDTLKIPRFSNFTVDTKAANTAVNAQTNTFSADSLLLDRHKVIQFLLEDIASLQAKVQIVQQYINQAGRDLAAEIDDAILREMEANVSSAAPDHIIAFDNSPTNTLSKGDVLNARELLNKAKVPVSDRFCVVSPLREAELMAIQEFTRVNEAGADQALRNGFIGRLFGFEVLMSPQVDDDATLFYHRSTCVFARQLAPRTQVEKDLAHLADRWSIDHIYGRKMLDSGKRAVRIKIGG